MRVKKKSSSPEAWSRKSGHKNHKIERRMTKPGIVRTIPFDLIDTEIESLGSIP